MALTAKETEHLVELLKRAETPTAIVRWAFEAEAAEIVLRYADRIVHVLDDTAKVRIG